MKQLVGTVGYLNITQDTGVYFTEAKVRKLHHKCYQTSNEKLLALIDHAVLININNKLK